jgi:hypothetical protein
MKQLLSIIYIAIVVGGMVKPTNGLIDQGSHLLVTNNYSKGFVIIGESKKGQYRCAKRFLSPSQASYRKKIEKPCKADVWHVSGVVK